MPSEIKATQVTQLWAEAWARVDQYEKGHNIRASFKENVKRRWEPDQKVAYDKVTRKLSSKLWLTG